MERQCGVPLPNGQPCARSLTCKSHSMGAKRAVVGRSLPYDMLLAAYQKKNQAKQQSKNYHPVQRIPLVNCGLTYLLLRKQRLLLMRMHQSKTKTRPTTDRSTRTKKLALSWGPWRIGNRGRYCHSLCSCRLNGNTKWQDCTSNCSLLQMADAPTSSKLLDSGHKNYQMAIRDF